MDIDSLESLTPADYLSLARRLRNEPVEGRPVKLALLSSNSFLFLEPYVVVECARRGLAATVWSPPFGQIEQAVLASSGGISVFSPDVIVVAMRIEDVFADAFLRPASGHLQDCADACVERLDKCVTSIRAITDATVLVANFATPHVAGLSGVFDAGDIRGPAHIANAANAELARRFADRADVLIWDYDGLVYANGAANWTDERLWHLARQPIASVNLPITASHLARTIAATVYQPAKCLVLDLDNTLWGGAAGDDGISGIQIGDDHPGNAFKALQSAVLGLKDRGVLLAISSKNDESVVREIFDNHPDMVTRWDDFAIARVNWRSKSENLKEIAQELNIGLDALVFFDDNPVEREEVRQHAPAVNVIDAPVSPLRFVDALLSSGLFDSPAYSDEDSKRSGHYRNEVRRRALRESAGSVQQFLLELEMQVATGPVGPETIARATQLLGKTNQFNLTTRRHSQTRLQRMSESNNFEVRWTRLSDRYGDSGIIGVTVVEYKKDEARIDSFLMSCRVMNRQVERAMLCDVIENAMSRDCGTLRGEYIASDRNVIVRDFYKDSGFLESGGEEGDSQFVLDLSDAAAQPVWPEVLRRPR